VFSCHLPGFCIRFSAQYARRAASDDSVWCDITGHKGIGTDDNIVADGARANNKDIGANPNIISNANRAGNVCTRGVSCMGSANDLDTMRSKKVISDRKGRVIPNTKIVAEAAISTNTEVASSKNEKARGYLGVRPDVD
jgi:hypothetical protein